MPDPDQPDPSGGEGPPLPQNLGDVVKLARGEELQPPAPATGDNAGPGDEQAAAGDEQGSEGATNPPPKLTEEQRQAVASHDVPLETKYAELDAKYKASSRDGKLKAENQKEIGKALSKQGIQVEFDANGKFAGLTSNGKKPTLDLAKNASALTEDLPQSIQDELANGNYDGLVKHVLTKAGEGVMPQVQATIDEVVDPVSDERLTSTLLTFGKQNDLDGKPKHDVTEENVAEMMAYVKDQYDVLPESWQRMFNKDHVRGADFLLTRAMVRLDRQIQHLAATQQQAEEQDSEAMNKAEVAASGDGQPKLESGKPNQSAVFQEVLDTAGFGSHSGRRAKV